MFGSKWTSHLISYLIFAKQMKEWVSGRLLLNANSAIFQLYYGENKYIFNKMMMRSEQQSADRHVAPLGHIILIPSQPVFALYP
jgi:hypothetical protein